VQIANSQHLRSAKRIEVGGKMAPGAELFDPVSGLAEPNKDCRTDMRKYISKCQFHGK
jgi:hypothetical protein